MVRMTGRGEKSDEGMKGDETEPIVDPTPPTCNKGDLNYRDIYFAEKSSLTNSFCLPRNFKHAYAEHNVRLTL